MSIFTSCRSENGKRWPSTAPLHVTKSGVSPSVELPGGQLPEKARCGNLPGRDSIEANTLGHSTPKLADGISGELLDVASGAFQETRAKMRPEDTSRSFRITGPPRKARISALMGATGA